MKKIFFFPLLLLSVANAEILQCQVHDVSDGDRFICLDSQQQKVTVLLANVDAPELKQVYGQEAKQALSKWIKGKNINFLAVNSELFCTREQNMDEKGQICADIGLEGYLTERENSSPEQSINYQMIEQGNAWLAPSPLLELGMTIYHKAEQDAREAKRGLWADADPIVPWLWRERNINQ